MTHYVDQREVAFQNIVLYKSRECLRNDLRDLNIMISEAWTGYRSLSSDCGYKTPATTLTVIAMMITLKKNDTTL